MSAPLHMGKRMMYQLRNRIASEFVPLGCWFYVPNYTQYWYTFYFRQDAHHGSHSELCHSSPQMAVSSTTAQTTSNFTENFKAEATDTDNSHLLGKIVKLERLVGILDERAGPAMIDSDSSESDTISIPEVEHDYTFISRLLQAVFTEEELRNSTASNRSMKKTAYARLNERKYNFVESKSNGNSVYTNRFLYHQFRFFSGFLGESRNWQKTIK